MNVESIIFLYIIFLIFLWSGILYKAGPEPDADYH